MKKSLEDKVEEEMISFYDYLDEKGVSFSIQDGIVATHEFIENYSNKDTSVKSDVLYNVQKELNDDIEMLLSRSSISVKVLDLIEPVMKEDYVYSSNISLYNKVYEKEKALYDRVMSATDEEIEQLLEYSENNIGVGYTTEQVVNKLGKPNKITKSTSSLGETKIYEYEDKFIYIHNDSVSRVVEF